MGPIQQSPAKISTTWHLYSSRAATKLLMVCVIQSLMLSMTRVLYVVGTIKSELKHDACLARQHITWDIARRARPSDGRARDCRIRYVLAWTRYLYSLSSWRTRIAAWHVCKNFVIFQRSNKWWRWVEILHYDVWRLYTGDSTRIRALFRVRLFCDGINDKFLVKTSRPGHLVTSVISCLY
jgi:hypothetical protein